MTKLGCEILGKLSMALVGLFGVVVVGACLGLLFAFPIKWCWNYTMPVLFGLKTITWGQAWCLNFVCGCLFKSSKLSIK